MQFLGVYFTYSFSSVVLDTSTRIRIVLTLYYEDGGWISEFCDIEAAFIHPNMEVKMYIEWPEGIVDLGIISEEFLREYLILLGNLMYGNFDAEILWIRLLSEYLANKCNIKRSKVDLYIFFRKDEKGKSELVMSVHMGHVSMAGNP